MKTIAITIWDTIVSPLYDSSSTLLIATHGQGRSVIDTNRLSLPDRKSLLVKNNAGVLLCGAISDTARTMLTSSGIEVISWLCGSAENLLADYRANKNVAEKYAMPGCHRRRCNRNRGNHHEGCSNYKRIPGCHAIKKPDTNNLTQE